MKQFEHELNDLKIKIQDMWQLVYSQVAKSKDALLNMNSELAYEVSALERKVDAFELVIDQNCENLIALHSPVAVDLRFILSCYKINSSLERIGDFAKSIANLVINFSQQDFDRSLIIETRTEEMFTEALEMLAIAQKAFEKQSTKYIAKVFAKDDLLDEINHNSISVLATLVMERPQIVEQALLYSSIIRKIERIGDHCNNISEEIVFYLEAKVLKHQKLKDEESI